MISACAETDSRPDRASAARQIHLGVKAAVLDLFECGCDVFGMLLVALEDLQAGLQQALELGIAGRRNEQALERAIDGLVIGDLVGDIGLVELRAFELSQFGKFGGRLLGQAAAGVCLLYTSPSPRD